MCILTNSTRFSNGSLQTKAFLMKMPDFWLMVFRMSPLKSEELSWFFWFFFFFLLKEVLSSNVEQCYFSLISTVFWLKILLFTQSIVEYILVLSVLLSG